VRFNQPGVAPILTGTIARILNPPADTSAVRVHVVSYYIDALANPNQPQLLRQVNTAAAVPIAENIENLQITYDIIDNAGVVQAGVSGTQMVALGVLPGQIRKVNLQLFARAPAQGLFRRGFDRVTLRTSVSIRNLTYSDPYPGGP
jgi:hypothetical protein